MKTIQTDASGARVLKLRDATITGAHADYRREHLVFARTQSPAMRACEWESRLKPMRPWTPNFVANFAFEIFA
jgi:hypothetical protein